MTYRNREKIPRRSPKRTPHPWVKFGLRVGRNPVAARVQAEAVEREDARIARMQAAGTLTTAGPAPFSMTTKTQVPYGRGFHRWSTATIKRGSAAPTEVEQRRNERMAKRWERFESLLRAMEDATRGIERASVDFRSAVRRMRMERMLAEFDAMRND